VPFYNRKRRPSTLGYASPLAGLANRISAQYEKTGGIMPRGWKTKNRGKLNAYIERLQIMVPNFSNREMEAK
jgi:hypothetical protein